MIMSVIIVTQEFFLNKNVRCALLSSNMVLFRLMSALYAQDLHILYNKSYFFFWEAAECLICLDALTVAWIV